MDSKKIILDLCGGTGSWSDPYKETGYDVMILTLPDFDVTEWRSSEELTRLIEQNEVYGILSAPPCTMFSIARNDKTARVPRDLRKGMKIVNSCLEIVHECLYREHKLSKQGLQFWALENPYSGYLKRFLGKPTMVFDPYEYGDPYTKRTALWGEFNVPQKNVVEPMTMEHLPKGSRDFCSSVEHYASLKQIPAGYAEKTGYTKRTIMRSMTPQGFAKAFFTANQ